MDMKTVHRNNMNVALVTSDVVLIADTQSALDFIATVSYETDCDRVVVNKAAFTEKFFILSTCLAGEILQKFINYHMKVAIVGDYSCYTSKPLKDFLIESNRGNDIYFAPSEEDAIEKLSKA